MTPTDLHRTPEIMERNEGRSDPASREASRRAITWFTAACFALAVCAMVKAAKLGVA